VIRRRRNAARFLTVRKIELHHERMRISGGLERELWRELVAMHGYYDRDDSPKRHKLQLLGLIELQWIQSYGRYAWRPTDAGYKAIKTGRLP
jgi:hypothetical protein